jgi:hypothetical protein
MFAAIAIGFIGNLILGIVLGKYHERFEWNKLIRQGKIPKPY